ncbi:LacI family DNA-binding transcriptional regulator [Lysinibacter sp. HNR]|uniref:LacI family DNA-binding transcriptional regulator n=1 Tax=Lysinibacter sp. HNR TaxID=3031408 RepID=UPI0024351CF2|nr:LacI family DNA-binding transcriptional regulator [Lysinibacter sp. HNR]WGD36975.1 LacI family DNA-binding transcriptional regulator [Lysinibacter sp. HNR]
MPDSLRSPMNRPSSPRKRATILDVAAEAGVSRGTVSRVLNGERYVSDRAKEAIEAAVIRVGYVPNTAARNLVRQRSQAVGFIVHEPHSLFLEDPNIGGILLGANATLSRNDYQMVCLVIDSVRDVERVGRYLSGGFVDGVIIVSARVEDPITQTIEKLRIPTAFVGHPPSRGAFSFVGINNRESAAMITTKLVETGRKRVGMIAAALDRDSGLDRLNGFKDALGTSLRPELIVEIPLYSYKHGFDGMTELLTRDPTLDGVFAASDAVAAGAIDALRRFGREVPGDVGIVGFDDSAWALRTEPPLSTVRQPAASLGEQAAELVLSELLGGAPRVDGVLLETPIVWRASA